MAVNCYERMFHYCTSLVTAPELPATTLTDSCYNAMFYHCTSLVTIPELPATTLAGGCYVNMFNSCTSLKLSTTKTGEYQYSYRIPTTGTLPARGSRMFDPDGYGNEVYGMFEDTGGTFIGTQSSTGMLPGRPLVNTTYYLASPTINEINRQKEAAESLEHALKFSSDGNFTLKPNKGKTWDGTLEYSIDNGCTWTTWTGSQLSGTADQPIYLRGDNNTAITMGNSYQNRWLFTGKYCTGNIENLLDYQTVANSEHPTMTSGCYANMFDSCTSLITAPVLPATTLADSCYNSMFHSCASLTAAPELPAMTLADRCYNSMFSGCTSLTTLPELPATELADYCYGMMFAGCAIKTTCSLPAMTLAKGCYSGMFMTCTSLETVLELPAKTLAESCYQEMFFGCTSLKTVSEISAETLAESCCSEMFSGCSALEVAPRMPATTLAKLCYGSMFDNCTSLKVAPELPATTLADRCYNHMFYNCTSLITAPELPATTLADYCYSQMFWHCTSLEAAPERLPATTLADYCYTRMFWDCTSLATAPELPATTLAKQCYSLMFGNCSSLAQIPELPATELVETCYPYMFNGCTALKLSATKTGIYQYAYRIPMTGTGTTATNALADMFKGTGGTFTGTPEINTTYYVPFETELSHILDAEAAESCTHALKFSSDANFTLKPNKGKTWDGTLEYTTDNGYTWTEWDGSQLSGAADQSIYLRGTGNTVITGNNTANKWVMTGSNVECHGNIENLLDYQTVTNGEHPTMGESCYMYMFKDCTSLATAPDLPATTLADYCYNSMFNGCTSLTAPPALPATMLAARCYATMFASCTALTTAPELPAMTLAPYCYYSMFRGCTSLGAAPELPATVLAEKCYYMMFYDCTALVSAPELPATTLAEYCYQCMFQNCTSLTTAPELPATTLAKSCYQYMFYNCTSLITAPVLSATTLVDFCYYNMFYGCTSLATVPELPATTLTTSCYWSMFRGCTSLKLSTTKTDEYQYAYRIPMTGTGTTASDALASMFTNTGGTFTGTPTINTTYYVPFETELSRILGAEAAEAITHALKFSSDANFTLKPNKGKTWNGTLEYSVDNGYTWTTWDGSQLSGTATQPIYLRGVNNTVITGTDSANKWVMTGSNVECYGNIENLLDYQKVANGEHPTMGDYCYYSMFSGCTSLTTAPELSATTLVHSCYENMFKDCTALTSAPELPATTLADYCYQSMFEGCESLTTAPELPATTLAILCYYRMFEGCTSLTTAPVLPATTLVWGCYWSMFYNCTSLTTAPELPATILTGYCYNGMFKNCTLLATAPELPATTLAENCYMDMFYDCTSLATAPELSATTLAENCYNSMFDGCIFLTTAPELPATILADSCYDCMFYDCISLMTAPELPATTLAEYCYDGMFYGCISLMTVPELPATMLAEGCYQSMFEGCDSLEVSDTQTDEYRYAYRVPMIGTGTDATDALTDMFASTGGTFTGTPEINKTYYLKIKPATHIALFVPGSEFNKTLKSLASESESNVVTPDTVITKIDWTDEAFTSDYNVGDVAYGEIYARKADNGVIELYTSMPDVYMPTDCSNMFAHMRSLNDVSFLDAMALDNITDMSGMFLDCKGLTTFDKTWLTMVNVSNMDRMFMLCSNLEELNLSGMNLSGLVSSEDMLMACSKLDKVIGPANLDDHVNIELPVRSGKAWYIDDDNDGVRDSNDKCTCVLPARDEVTTFICQDIRRPDWYVVSVPARISLSTTDYTNFAREDKIRVEITSDDPADTVYVALDGPSPNAVTVPFVQADTGVETSLSITLDDNEFTIESEGMTGYGETKMKDSALHLLAPMDKTKLGEYAGTFEVVYSGYQNYIDRTLNLEVLDELGYIYNPMGEYPVIKDSDGNVVTKLDIPATYHSNKKSYRITAIDGQLFKDCRDLESVTVPDTVTEIGARAFENCSGINKPLVIPDSVENIGDYAFWKSMPGGIIYRDELYVDTDMFNDVLISDGVATGSVWDPLPVPHVTAPTAKEDLMYNGTEQVLINEGSAVGGTIEYKVNDGEYSTDLPVGVAPGDYTVYYRVKGDADHYDLDEKSINVTISNITYTIVYNGNGATSGSTASSSHMGGAAKALTTNGFDKTGHTFAGWATSPTGPVVYSDQQSVTDLTFTNGGTFNLYAKWTNSWASDAVTLNFTGESLNSLHNIGGVKIYQPDGTYISTTNLSNITVYKNQKVLIYSHSSICPYWFVNGQGSVGGDVCSGIGFIVPSNASGTATLDVAVVGYSGNPSINIRRSGWVTSAYFKEAIRLLYDF